MYARMKRGNGVKQLLGPCRRRRLQGLCEVLEEFGRAGQLTTNRRRHYRYEVHLEQAV